MKVKYSITILILTIFSHTGFQSFAQSDSLNTFLFEAVKNNNLPKIKELVENGANVNAKDDSTATPIMWAAYKCEIEIFHFLVSQGAICTNESTRPILIKDNSSWYFTTLSIAAGQGKLEILKFLIEKLKINVNIQDKKNRTALHYACYNGHKEVVEYLINQGANINIGNSANFTPFHGAVIYNHLDIVKLLIKNGADVNAKTTTSETALHYATQIGSLEITKTLISKGVDINAENNNGYTPFYLAIEKNNKDIADLLIANGVNINKVWKNGQTPLHFSIEKNSFDIVKLLINHKVIIDVKNNDGNPPLYVSVIENKPKIASILIKNGADITFKDENGFSLLHQAAMRNYTDIAKLIIDNGIDVNIKSKDESTPLHQAAMRNYVDVAELLISKGANINAKDSSNRSPLFQAAFWGKGIEVIQLLLESGADINTSGLGNDTPLHISIYLNRNEIAELLIKKGADTNKKNDNEVTPIYWALARKNNRKILSLLLDKEKDLSRINVYGNTLLHRAYKYQDIEILRLLIEKGTNVNAKNKDGSTVLHEAAYDNNFEILKLLLENGAEINAKDTAGTTPLHQATWSNSIEAIKLLLKNNAQINIYNNNGMSPLNIAIAHDNAEIAKLYIKKGADIYYKDNDNITSLHWAARSNSTEITQLLLEKGLNINAQEYTGRTPLHWAIMKKRKEVSKFLIENNANLDIVNKKGAPPLHSAIWDGCPEIAKLIIHKGANVNIKDSKGYTALYWAVSVNNIDLVKLLIEKGAKIDIKTITGLTPLSKAVSKGYVKISRLLIENGANINITDNNGNTLIHKAIKAYSKELVGLLLKYGVNNEKSNKKNATPIVNAIFCTDETGSFVLDKTMINLLIDKNTKFPQNYELIDSMFIKMVDECDNINFIKLAYLLGPDLKYKDKSEQTCLDIASLQGKKEIFNFLQNPYKAHTLIELGLHSQAITYLEKNPHEILKRNEKGKNLLHIAVKSNNPELIEYLCNLNTNLINTKDNEGTSPLLEAIIKDAHETGSDLIKYGADPYLKNNSGYSPQYIALERNNKKWLEIFSKSKIRKSTTKPFPQLKIPGNNNAITSICLSKDNKYAFSGDLHNNLKIWDISTGIEIGRFIEPYSEISSVHSIAFSPNNKTILTVRGFGMQKEISLWDIVSKKKINSFIGATSNAEHVSFSSNGKKALSYGTDKIIRLWDVTKGKEIQAFSGHTESINSVCFSPNEKFVLSASDDKTIKLWNTSNGKELKSYIVHNKKVNSVSFSQNGKYILSCSGDKTIKLIKTKSGKTVKTFEGHTAEVISARFSDNDEFIFSAGNDNTIRKWNLEDCTPIKTFTVKDLSVACFSTNNDYVLAGTAGGELGLWELLTSKKIKSFEKPLNHIGSISLSRNNKQLLFGYNDKIKLWNISKACDIKTFSGHSGLVNSVSFSSDGEQLLSCTGYSSTQEETRYRYVTQKEIIGFHYQLSEATLKKPNKKNELTLLNRGNDLSSLKENSWGEVKLWNISTGKEFQNFEKQNGFIHSACFSPSRNYILSGGDKQTMKLWNSNTGKLIKSFSKDSLINKFEKTLNKYLQNKDSGTSDIKSVCFTSDSKYALSVGGMILKSGLMKSEMKLWDIDKGIIIKNFNTNNAYINSVCLTNNNHFALTGSVDNTIRLWDIKTGNLIRKFVGHNEYIESVCFSPDENFALSASKDCSLKLWDLNNGNCLKTFKGHNGAIQHGIFHNSGKYIFSSSAFDNSIRIWSIETGNELLKIIPLNNYEHIIIAPDNYYKSTKGCLSNLGWSMGMQTFTFEQFDLKYNRPDIILSRLPDGDTTLIPLYYKAYQKRLKKMNFTEEMLKSDFHIPKIEITNKDNIEHQVNKSEIELKIKASDSKYELNRLNVWVNNIPIYGINGIDLRPVQTGLDLSIMRKISIPLSEGENKIDVSALNQAGAESLKQTVYVNYTPKNITKPNLYVVAIGVSEYENNHFNLNYAAKDANDLSSEFLKKKEQFGEIKTIKLLDKEASLDKIKAIKDTLMQSNIEDEVVVFFAGHGLLDEDLDYYLALSNMNFDKPSEFGLPYEELENLLDGIPARKKLLLIDACHSGEVDKDENSEMEIVSENTKDMVVHRGVSPLGFKKSKKKVGLKNSFELMKELFADLRRGTGAMVISSAGGGEFAFEGEQWKNGVFTYSVIQALRTDKADKNKDGIVQVSELRDFVQDMVKKLTNGKQNPTSRRENLEFDFGVF